MKQGDAKLAWRDAMIDACAALIEHFEAERTVSKDQNEFHRDVTDLRQNKGTRALLIISS